MCTCINRKTLSHNIIIRIYPRFEILIPKLVARISGWLRSPFSLSLRVGKWSITISVHRPWTRTGPRPGKHSSRDLRNVGKNKKRGGRRGNEKFEYSTPGQYPSPRLREINCSPAQVSELYLAWLAGARKTWSKNLNNWYPFREREKINARFCSFTNKTRQFVRIFLRSVFVCLEISFFFQPLRNVILL